MVRAKRNVQVQVTTAGANRNRRGPARTAAGNTRRTRIRRRRGAVTVSLSTPVLRNGARRRRVARSRRNVTNAVHRTLQKTGVLGPKPAISQSATATLGTIGANQGQDVELEGAFMLNPALTKETTGSNQFGPVQIAAATYNMWKLKRAQIRLTPLVGSSAVSGTAVRVSLNLSGAPSSSSWSALGARKHADTSPGRFVQFTITDRDVPGPKEGWFMTSTKGTPEMAIGGTIEIHTLGKTLSTYTNEEYKGDLFLVELHATWQFANYSPNPGMLNLVKGTAQETAGQVTISANPGEPITITTPATSEVTRAAGGRMINPARAAGAPTVGEVVWQIVDTTVDQITSNFPPPFNWLFKGGWWFMKRVVGLDASRDAAGDATFYVYQSITDAKNNSPCIASTSANTTLASSSWEYAQITPGNSGLSEDATARVLDTGNGGADPPEPTIDPNLPISWVGSYVEKNFSGGDDRIQFGLTTLLFRQQTTASSAWIDKRTQPDYGPCVRISYYSNLFPFIPNNVVQFDAALTDHNTQFETWMQYNLGSFVSETDPINYVHTMLPVYESTSNTVIGDVVLGSTMYRSDQVLYITTLVFKCNQNISLKWGVDTARTWGYINRGPNDEDTSLNRAPLNMSTRANSTGSTAQMQFNSGVYYGMVYFGSTLDPYVQLNDSVRLPLACSTIANNSNIQLALARKHSTENPSPGAIFFSVVGMQSGLNIPFVFMSNPNISSGAWHGTIPTSTLNMSIENYFESDNKLQEIDETLQKLQHQISKMQLDGTDKLEEQIKFEEYKDQVDALIRSPTPLTGACGGESESDLGSHTDTEDSGSDTETEQDNLYPPLECECRWGGHKHCPYPKRDELWSDPPEDICEVDGTQHGLVNVLIKGGLSPRKAKRAIALQNEDSPARVFQNLYEAHIECGLAKNTARGLSYCHALRALAGHDPYEVDSEEEQPALKKPKY